MAEAKTSEFIFPGQRAERPLSNMAFAMLLRRMGLGDVTAHGFRSAFRDWCAEQTNTPREIAEQCLAHKVGSKIELAYYRSDALEKRRDIMAAWARHCEPEKKPNVIALPRGGRAS